MDRNNPENASHACPYHALTAAYFFLKASQKTIFAITESNFSPLRRSRPIQYQQFPRFLNSRFSDEIRLSATAKRHATNFTLQGSRCIITHMNGQQDTFCVTGMNCSACSARVERAVGQLPGVQNVQVNLLTGSMRVCHEETLTPPSHHCSGRGGGLRRHTRQG